MGDQVFIQENESDKTIKVELPQVEAFKDGKFFCEWIDPTSSGDSLGTEFVEISYDDRIFSYRDIYVEKKYDKVMRNSGIYELRGEIYQLGNSGETWKVGTDGYSYNGGIEFYGPGVSYTYTKN